ncbi:hypothetical protein KL86DYS1_30900 [uncultured Dysgonomonas sp.]|uniref:Uncharacterized protein n=1 Tax=uncultured Dysgonomonas sp. TaxID=206096 RepID=A0A212JYS2_9BACT|nr:hypothetical protein KL86DYS1_30900 [uncultured Dysgonomonas sp.]
MADYANRVTEGCESGTKSRLVNFIGYLVKESLQLSFTVLWPLLFIFIP